MTMNQIKMRKVRTVLIYKETKLVYMLTQNLQLGVAKTRKTQKEHLGRCSQLNEFSEEM